MIVERSARRVSEHTPKGLNQQIQQRTELSIAYYTRHPELIDGRLDALDREWDIERMLQANAATLILSGTVAGVLGSKRWLVLPAVVSGFLLQHAVQGWCPPMPLLRRMGFRTPREIEAERYALKALRGDFQNIPAGEEGARSAIRATGRF